MKKGGVIQFCNICTHSKVNEVFVLCKLEINDIISGYSIETNHKMKNISGKNGPRKLKLGTNIVP